VIVVSDTSPIRALAHLGLTHLLAALFDHVVIPPAVAKELTDPRVGFTPILVHTLPFVEIRQASDSAVVADLLTHLDQGESEAIALAIELHCDVLIDEAAGRAEATRRGLRWLGVLGILVDAKGRKLIADVRSLLDRLEKELNFFISPQLRQKVLIAAGE
jgi:hypothetical protein